MASCERESHIRAIAHAGSISAAAEMLGISQPALSASLKKTESKVGSILFDRSASPIAITDAGRAYLEYEDGIAKLERDLERKVSDIENMRCGKLVVGGATSFNIAFLAPAIASFSTRFPGIEVSIVDDTAPNLAQAALGGAVDIFVTPNPPADNAFDLKELVCERIFLCLPTEWPVVADMPRADAGDYASIGRNEFELLREYPFVMLNDDQQIGRKLRELFQLYDFEPRKTIRATQSLTSLALTMQGAGASLAAESVLRPGHMEGHLALYLPESAICMRTLYIATPRNHHTSRAAREFARLLAESVA